MKIVEVLSSLLPEDKVKEVSEAVDQMLENAKSELEKEFDGKLEEAYAELSEQLKEQEKVAYQGYAEAMQIITDLRNRLETQSTEFEKALEEGYEEAYQMLQTERGKNEELESQLYETYEGKLKEVKDYMVEKVSEYLEFKGQEIYEQARREVLTDPALVEHKLAMEKIVDVVSNYISEEDYASVNGKKIEEAVKEIGDLRGQIRLLEAKNIRITTQNDKLNEQVRNFNQMINESTQATEKKEKKEIVEKAKNAEGRGKKVTEAVEVIAEAKDETPKKEEKKSVLVENMDPEQLRQLQILSGVVRSE